MYGRADATIDTLRHLQAMERDERTLARIARTHADRDRHFMNAEQAADRAWAIAENGDAPFIPSGLWGRRRHEAPVIAAVVPIPAQPLAH